MSSIMFRDTERALPRTTREGLHAFLTRQRPQVIPLTRAAYEKLSAALTWGVLKRRPADKLTSRVRL